MKAVSLFFLLLAVFFSVQTEFCVIFSVLYQHRFLILQPGISLAMVGMFFSWLQLAMIELLGTGVALYLMWSVETE